MIEAPRPLRVVITGAARGIGRATALAFASRGAFVASLDRQHAPEASTELAAQITAAGGRPVLVVGDTTRTADVDGLADHVVQEWGGIDVWVNNAADVLVRPFLQITDEEWAELLDSNLMGYVRGARAAARHMVSAGGGVIINVSSAVDPYPPADMTAYTTAKAGVGGLTRALAVELGKDGVRVVAVAPGATETPLNHDVWTEDVRATYLERIPLRRIAEPEEIADAIVAVAAPACRYMTGQTILVDGGLTLNGSVGHRST